MRYSVIELICSVLAFAVAILLYRCSSGLVYVYKFLAIMPLLILNILYFPQLYGEISVRKYVGLKLTFAPLSFLLLSIRLSTYDKYNVLLMGSVGLMIIIMAVELLYLHKTKNSFYNKLVTRHALYTILTLVCDTVLLLVH